MVAKQSKATIIQKVVAAIVLIAVSPLLLLAIVLCVLYLVAGVLLHIAVWCVWCTRGRDVLLVYSNSPIWQEYFEQYLLPQLGHRAVLLNWPERRLWRHTLAVTVFRYFGGSREYNPMAVVFRPFRVARTFRFYKPFRDFKHGKPQAVAELTERLFAMLNGNKVQTV